MCVLRQQGGRQQDKLSFCIFMLLESVRTGSPLLLQIKIIHVLILSLEVIFQEKEGHYDQVQFQLFVQTSVYGLGTEDIFWTLEEHDHSSFFFLLDLTLFTLRISSSAPKQLLEKSCCK